MFRLVFLLLFFCGSLSAQDISIELGGVGGLGSVSYSDNFIEKEQFQLQYRVGFTFVPIDQNNGTVLGFPLLVHGVFGKTRHFLDIGIGQGISITTKGNFFILGLSSFGYRYNISDKLYTRIAYTPFISYLVDRQWNHWGGITFGYKIGK